MPRYSDSGVLKGYAKAVLATTEGVDRVVAQNPHCIGGLEVGILKWQSPNTYLRKKNQENKRKVYVRIPFQMTEESLYRHFSRVDEVEYISIKTQPVTNQRRNFCYILFKTKNGADQAVQQNPHVINKNKLFCEPSIRPDHETRHSNMEKRLKMGIFDTAPKVVDDGGKGRITSSDQGEIQSRNQSDLDPENFQDSRRSKNFTGRFRSGLGEALDQQLPREVRSARDMDNLPKVFDWSKAHIKPTSSSYSKVSLAFMERNHRRLPNFRFNVSYIS